MHFKIIVLCFFLFSSCCVVANTQAKKNLQQLRDPFQYFSPKTYNVNFINTSIAHLTLLGSLSFGKTAYALVGAKSGVLRWLKVGDIVGSEKGVIVAILKDKIQLQEKDKSTVKLWEIKRQDF